MTGKDITLGIQIVPKSKNHDTYELVDQAIAIIMRSGRPYRVTPFETVMTGKYDELMDIAKQAQKAVLEAGADECLVYFRIHYRQHQDVTFEEKNLDR